MGHQAVLRALADLGTRARRLGGARPAAGAGLDAVAARYRPVARRSPPTSKRCSWSRTSCRSSRRSSRRRCTACRGHRGCSASRTPRAASCCRSRAASSADDVARALATVLPGEGAPEALVARIRGRGRGSLAPARPARARAQAHALLLLGMPAQHLDASRRRAADRRRHRLPHDGRARDRRAPRSRARDGADGRRGRAVVRPRPVRERAALHAEPRRRHLPPLRLAGDPRGDRGGRQHHLPAALQRAPSR